MTKVKKKNESAVARISEATCLSFARFRSAIRQGRIDALFARRIFRRHYTRLKDICVREGCSLARARTINAMLEADVNSALVSAGQSGILKAYQSVDDLLRDLQLIRTGSHQELGIGEK